MSDEWVKEAGRRGDEAEAYASWIDSNEDSIVEQYAETISIDDVPEDYINDKYQEYLEHGDEERNEYHHPDD